MFNAKFIVLLLIVFSGLVNAAVTQKQIEQLERRFVVENKWGIPYPSDVLNEKWYQPRSIAINKVKTSEELKALTGNKQLKLNGNTSKINANFGTRLDRVITDAVLNLDFIYSPTLIAKQSQLKISLNGDLVGVVRINEKTAGKLLHQKVKLPHLRMSDYNQLTFELIGYSAGQCVDPFHQGLWFELMPSSRLDLTQQVVPLKNDLSLLPAPFFDKRQLTKQNVTLVFPSQPSSAMVHSASKFGAWFGAQSRWRGNEFSFHFNELPTQHAVVFATNNNRPFFLKDYPDVFEPTVVMVSHPLNRALKMLLVLGENTQQLDTAAEGVVMAYNSLSGQVAVIEQVKYAKKLQPYDAPLWVNTERPMRFYEFVDDAAQLQKTGIHINPIQFSMHIPTDLFIWETRGAPVDLSYRYTPPSAPQLSKMSVLINDQLIESFSLINDNGIFNGDSLIRMPFSKDNFTVSSDFLIPSFKLGMQNTMKFDFNIKDKRESCISDVTEKTVMVDGNSTIDFSGFEHYAEMPDLASFTFSGLPFTKMADLSETTIVLPKNYSEHEISLLFSLLARMSSITGYPAINHQLVTVSEPSLLVDRDIILINALETLTGENVSNDSLKVLIDKNKRSISLASDVFVNNNSSSSKFTLINNDDVLVSVTSQSFGDLAAITEFESPFSNGRTVLSIMSNRPKNLALVEDALNDPNKSYLITGAATVFHHNKISSSGVGEKYYTGHLPVWSFTRYHLSQRPVLLLIIVLLAVFLLAIIVWRFLAYTADKRLENHETN